MATSWCGRARRTITCSSSSAERSAWCDTRQDEPPVALHTLVPGDLAGELSFIDDTERYASLQAEGPTRVMSLRRPALESLLKSDPEIVYRTMRAIIRTAHAIQRRLSSQSVELANYIYKQHGRY